MSIRFPRRAGCGALVTLLALAGAVLATPGGAAEAPVGLGTLASYAVLGASAVTNTGPTVVGGDLGVSPGTSITGFPPGVVTGSLHAGDSSAASAQDAATTAYDDAAGRTATGSVGPDLGGQTFGPGVYVASSTLVVTGTATLDAHGDPSAVFVFRIGSTLTTASGSTIALTGEAQACNVFWQVGSSATLGTGSDFAGTILALASVTATTGADVEGRLVARNGAVTLDTNDITTPVCAASTPSSTTTSTSLVATTTTAVTPAGDGAGTAATTTTTSASGSALPGTTTTTARAGATTGGATRTGGPALPRTGVSLAWSALALGLVAGGLLLTWFGRPTLAHARGRRHLRPVGRR
jgi:hypothetical protein